MATDVSRTLDKKNTTTTSSSFFLVSFDFDFDFNSSASAQQVRKMTSFPQLVKIIDFVWTLCSQKSTTPITGQVSIISCTTLVRRRTSECLPAIDQSPTNPDTVLELLIQPKAKVQRLVLNETDVVVDQAIYAKVVEILANPN